MIGEFFEVVKDVFRLRVPFEAIYTSVFLIKSAGKIFLVDCATTEKDVDTCILPALEARGVRIGDLTALVLTHRHADHAGGLMRMLELAPDLAVISGGDTRALTADISVLPLHGHTEDSIGVFDARTNTLVTGDGLQGAGVDRYPCLVKNREAYVRTLDMLKENKSIENLLFSHAYEPWGKDVASGRAAVERCLHECEQYIKYKGES